MVLYVIQIRFSIIKECIVEEKKNQMGAQFFTAMATGTKEEAEDLNFVVRSEDGQSLKSIQLSENVVS